MPDKISIRQLEVKVILGVRAEERLTPQSIWIDLDYCFDMKRAAESDQLRDTLDYSLVCDKIQSYISKTQFQLIEALAENTAKFLMMELSMSWLRLSITKKPSDMPQVGAIHIEIERESADKN